MLAGGHKRKATTSPMERRAHEKVLLVILLITMRERPPMQCDIANLEIARISMCTILIAKLLVMISKSPRVINFFQFDFFTIIRQLSYKASFKKIYIAILNIANIKISSLDVTNIKITRSLQNNKVS